MKAEIGVMQTQAARDKKTEFPLKSQERVIPCQ